MCSFKKLIAILQGPEHCVRCRSLFLRTQTSSGITCLDSCPVGTYLVPESSECVPCHEHCNVETGCAGPLPYLNRENGCIDCSLVQLRRSGEQVSQVGSYRGEGGGSGGNQYTILERKYVIARWYQTYIRGYETHTNTGVIRRIVDSLLALLLCVRFLQTTVGVWRRWPLWT